MTYLHVGSGQDIQDGFINTDTEVDITQKLPYEDRSVSGITSMHVLCELNHRQILSFFREARRILEDNGVLRIGVPHIYSGYGIDLLLGWGNTTLFSEELLTFMLQEAGFATVRRCQFKETASDHPIITQPDNRQSETLYMEGIK